jgi:hypothetical protein
MDEDIDELISQLKPPYSYDNPDSQLEACIKLGELGKKTSDIRIKQRIIDSLIDAINSKNCGATRAQAVESLGNLSSKKPIDRLKYSLKDPYRLVRSYSITALAKLNDESSIYPLIDCMKNSKEHGTVRSAASGALKQICKDSESYDCSVAWQAIDEVHLEAADVLDKTDTEDYETKSIFTRLWNETTRPALSPSPTSSQSNKS